MIESLAGNFIGEIAGAGDAFTLARSEDLIPRMFTKLINEFCKTISFIGKTWWLWLIVLVVNGCERPDPEVTIISQGVDPTTLPIEEVQEGDGTVRFIPPTPQVFGSPTPLPTYLGTPTPNPISQAESGLSGNFSIHTVSVGETLGQIALEYNTTVEELVDLNDLEDVNVLAVGQELQVPGGDLNFSPSFKLIPDSEFVFGPTAKDFDVTQFVAQYGGYLLSYFDEVEGRQLNGTEVVQLVAERQSINPRILLAIIEHKTGWVVHSSGQVDDYPLGFVKQGYEGLYQQLSWAANIASLGFYGRSEGGYHSFDLASGEKIFFAPDINDGTAGLQVLFASFPTTSYQSWLADIGSDGIFATYSRLFGNPFAYTFEPIVPENLTQPSFELPWSEGEKWYFTGGPHGGWANGTAWAALDFAPPEDQLGCYQSDAWVTAMVDGLVTRSDFGAVVIDIDADGYAGTGWSLSYLHLASDGRVPVGSFVRAGDAIGHPSCEGGFSNGTHVHIARTYNGRWISADGELPFIIDGWVAQGLGREYDGMLIKGDTVKEACECREEINEILAE